MVLECTKFLGSFTILATYYFTPFLSLSYEM